MKKVQGGVGSRGGQFKKKMREEYKDRLEMEKLLPVQSSSEDDEAPL